MATEHCIPVHDTPPASESSSSDGEKVERVARAANMTRRRSVQKQQYDTHFYCALCGGPFGQVFRTATTPAPTNLGDNLGTTVPHEHDPADTDVTNIFNIPEDENDPFPEEYVLGDMSYVAQRSRRLRQQAQREGRRKGVMPEPRNVQRAYDGKRISVKQMKWTRNLRALVNRQAREHPAGYEQVLAEGGDQLCYLTGRGLVRECYNWADAYADVDHEELVMNENGEWVLPEYPIFSDHDRLNNTFGFHLYKELNGNGEMRSQISSIPFHDECLSLLQLAVVETGKELNLVPMDPEYQPERLMEGLVEYDVLWGYLRSMITTSGMRQEGMQIAGTLQSESRGDVITRLGELDYREAEAGGEGWHWKHEEGCHWLAADPLMTPLLGGPVLKTLPCTSALPQPPRLAKVDPFMRLPAEIVLEICHSLSSADIFRWKAASPYIMKVELPETYYRRFLREDFKFLHNLTTEIEEHLAMQRRRGKPNTIDWRGSFERLHRLMRTPRLSGNPEQDERAWDTVDISLKNRRRIWSIVKPIAETLVPISPVALLNMRGGVFEDNESPCGLVRGLAGKRTSREGSTQVVWFGKEMADATAPRVPVTKVEMWTDKETGVFCGMRFYDSAGPTEEVLGTFGRRGGLSHPIILGIPQQNIAAEELVGIGVCMADSIICGAQLFVLSRGEERRIVGKDRIGIWDGPLRKIIAPHPWRKMVGVTGFLNSAGFIETMGLLEKTGNPEPEGLFGVPPPTMPLSHQEASVWNCGLPPSRISMIEREGPGFPEWRTTGADWEIWASQEAGTRHQYVEDGLPGTLDSPATKGRLVKIVGYYDKEFLRCLEFHYESQFGYGSVTPLVRRMGNREPPAGKHYEQTTYILRGQRIFGAVINHSPEGIRGILFVNESDQNSGVIGAIYHGIHKVFGPLPTDTQLRRYSQRTLHREELVHPIIGLHAIYDDEENRFLQLGLILPQEDGHSVFPTSLTQPIPFDVSEDTLVWVTKPPDQRFVVGNNRIFSEHGEAYEHPFGLNEVRRFTGWAPLENLERVTIYGNLNGITFTYWDSKEMHFGNTACLHDILVQEFERDETVVGIEWIRRDEDPQNTIAPKCKQEEGYCASIISRSTHQSASLERFRFITNRTQRQFSSTERYFRSDHLRGIKLDFSAHQIVCWYPLYSKLTLPAGDQWDREIAETNLFLEARFPWKKLPLGISAEPYFPENPNTDPIAISFLPSSDGKIDAIKGYTDISGSPCGLLLRRNGRWSQAIFGQRSAYETTFELEKDEEIESIILPCDDDARSYFSALAFATTRGRISNWIGSSPPKSHPVPQYRDPRYKLVGFYAVYKDPSTLNYGCVAWDTFGALHRDLGPTYTACHQPRCLRRPPPPTNNGRNRRDDETGLLWLTGMTPLKITLSSLAISPPYQPFQFDSLGRACSHFDPSQLLQIRVWPGVTGIKGIRFRGGPEMGIVTIGDWPDSEDKGLSAAYKMSIAGPSGERVQRMKLSFQSVEVYSQHHPTYVEYRLIGLELETNRGRYKRIVSPSLIPENPRDLTGDVIRSLECPTGKMVCGLHGVFSRGHIHDLGFAVMEMDKKSQSVVETGERPSKRARR